MPKMAAWIMLLSGVGIAAWPVWKVASMEMLMEKFGGVPWSNVCSASSGLCETWGGELAFGLLCAGAGLYWLLRRYDQPMRNGDR